MKNSRIKKFMLIMLAAVIAFSAPLLVFKMLMFAVLSAILIGWYSMRRFKKMHYRSNPVFMRQVVVEDAQIL